MSRWTEAQDNHAYKTSWQTLRDNLDPELVDAAPSPEVADELKRMIRVVSFIDGLLPALDAELVPISAWQAINQHASAANTQLTAYKGGRGVNHVSTANDNLDVILTTVRPLVDLPKESIASLKKAATWAAKSVETTMTDQVEQGKSLLEELEAENEKAKALNTSIETVRDEARKVSLELVGDEETEGLQGEAETLLSNLEERHKEIEVLHTKMFDGVDGEKAIQAVIEEATSSITETRENFEKEAEQVSDQIHEINEFHVRAFGVETDEGDRTIGYKSEFDKLLKKLEEFEEKQKKKYTALNEQIESLLPGATTAGLASAYTEMKGTFDDPIKTATRVFYTCIGILIAIALYSTVDYVGGTQWIKFKAFTDWQITLRGVVAKLPMYGPAIWLAYYSSKRRSEAQRLQQEYAHKEAVAKSYTAYKKQIDELGNVGDEIRAKLLAATVDTITHNASTTLDGEHGDKSPAHEAIGSLDQVLKNPVFKELVKKLPSP